MFVCLNDMESSFRKWSHCLLRRENEMLFLSFTIDFVLCIPLFGGLCICFFSQLLNNKHSFKFGGSQDFLIFQSRDGSQ